MAAYRRLGQNCQCAGVAFVCLIKLIMSIFVWLEVEGGQADS